MKKLSLKNLNLGANDLLQRNQLKTVFGGDGGYSGGSGVWCKCTSPNSSATGPESSCGACENYCMSAGYSGWWCFG